MPLSKEKMKEYQRKKRAEAAGKVYVCKPEEPEGLQVEPKTVYNPANVNPICKPVNPEKEDCKPDICKPCSNCKPEYDRGYKEGFEAGKQVYHNMPKPAKSAVSAPGKPDIQPDPVKRPVYACNFFNPQPKSTTKPSRNVPPATRPPSIKPVSQEVSALLSKVKGWTPPVIVANSKA